MKSVPLDDAEIRLAELAREVEQGSTIVLTRDGRPILDLVPHRGHGGIDFAAGEAFLSARGITRPAPFVAADFDDPLPPDVLLH